jgi:alcohol dehydrogenase (cytochrome c)
MLAQKTRRLLIVFAFVAVAAVVAAHTPAVRWRAEVISLKASGKLPEIPLTQLVEWLTPLSPVWLGALPEQPNVAAAVRNRNDDEAQMISAGQAIFDRTCSHCHGGDANGGVGPSLISAVTTETDWNFLSTAKWGRAGTAMTPQPLSDAEIWQVHSFLRNRAKVSIPMHSARIPEGTVNVTMDQLLNAPKHTDEWLMYNGDFTGSRYSRLNLINKDNIHNLRVAWAAQLRPSTRPLSATPIVVGGIVFVTEAPDGVVALDARTGQMIWRYRRPLDNTKLALCCSAFNRGVAVFGGTLYLVTLDSHLIAINAHDGAQLWDIKVGDPADGFSMTSAPLVVEGHVILGVAGGEFGMRGFVAAYAPEDGRQLWKLDTVPAPGHAHHDTWSGDSWKTGGGPTWMTGVYDAERDVVYWETGNPWPDLDDSTRKGDNLYTNCMLAIDRKTGKLLWHFQFTPADVHDWDATQQPVLTDIQLKGATVPVIVVANRNGYYYALDRRDGKFLYATQFVKQTWNTGFTPEGRPIPDPAARPARQGTMVWPWMHGGSNWWPPSYDPVRKLHYAVTVDAATVYFTIDEKEEAGQMTMGGTTHLANNQPAIVAIKAIDPATGLTKWSARLDHDDFQQYSRVSGVISTAGGFVFGGFEDRFVALDSDTGEELWNFHPGGKTNAAPISYAIDGVQYITVLAGNVLFSFALPPAKGPAVMEAHLAD